LSFAPIAIFAFNRPTHLENLLNSLVANPEARNSKIFIFVDGPRNSNDSIFIDKVIIVIRKFQKELPIEIVQSPQNLGLASSLLSGIDLVFRDHETIIVLEDDLLLANTFLRFCNEGLSRYRFCDSIASIQGYSPIKFDYGNRTYFLRGADCWGWATWKDRWLKLNRDANSLLYELQQANLTFEFDLDGSFPYTDMLRRNARSEVDSWAIRWHASMFLQGRLSIYPGRSLVLNTGFDGSGTHSGNFLDKEVAKGLPTSEYAPRFDDSVIVENKKARALIKSQARKRYRSYPFWHPFGFLRIFSGISRRFFRN
jgi:hypothetical protein